jgi:hypothetical protein
MTDNLSIWNRFADIDPKHTKPITGKSYKGTSPNPQYIIQCLTEMFGPVGKGFGWEVLHEGFTPLGEEILHWCRIRFWHGARDNWFESYGQTKALMKTRNGMMSDEDAPKKSLTDAIVKAASHIGIAANIFLGRWDDQKYVSDLNSEFREKEGGRPANDKGQNGPVSAAEMKRGLVAIDQDLLDCHTVVAVNKCADAWKHIAHRDGWTKDYITEAAKKFQGRRDLVSGDDFPGDRKDAA